MKIPELFIFDMDGLLFDTERMFMRELQRITSENGYNLTEEIYITTLGLAGDALKRRLEEVFGSEYNMREFGRRTRERMNEIADTEGLPVKAGIRELLARIADRRSCVASSTDTRYVKHYLKTAGLDGCFDFVIGGDMVKRSKPEPDIFLKACETAGVKPESAVVFEDSENGIRAAYSAGIPAVCIPDMKQPDSEIRQKSLFVAKDAWEAARLLGL